MLIKTFGSNAEFVRQFPVNANITRIGIPNSRRQSGLIVNYSKSKLWLEFGNYPHRLLSDPTRTIIVPANGGNTDFPPDWIGAVWAMWANPQATGHLNIYHYFYSPT
jgi:hypothetical protein